MEDSTSTKAGCGNPTPTPLPPKRRLKSAQDLRVFLADVANRLNRDEIDGTKARALGYLAQVMASIIQTSDLEQRIKVLEEKENL
ncbi:hypothetical protein [Desulfovibrio sp. Huiquan2017]|uniref:hypothetical protein n=1 Tax=Desulfovibrio sp. Huiquan2017 TaxID=2816861 RepID=UPI001A919A60|nr:hypothetical protein [Desulfovibrio sp. Huiquan2017]